MVGSLNAPLPFNVGQVPGVQGRTPTLSGPLFLVDLGMRGGSQCLQSVVVTAKQWA